MGTPALRAAGLRVRVLSYDVRRGHCIPDVPGKRHGIYVGTGGPGHLDPRLNDGISPGSQGIAEDPGWEGPLFGLFDANRADDDAALLAVCHTFGVMCRWLGIADAVLRGPEKGGKSSGIVDNVLTDAALRQLWEAELAAMRDRILAMRQALHRVISAKLPGRDFGYFLSQRGMFSYTGLSAAQVDRLREEFGVYMVRSGRICVAGLNNTNVEPAAAAMAAVMTRG